jgi:hypothetical protein
MTFIAFFSASFIASSVFIPIPMARIVMVPLLPAKKLTEAVGVVL